jgi:anaerobic magnesium-protoporphyrin IX monomethyl ester cyclase
MKILLIQALTVHDQPPIYPIGLACIAAYLRDHDVTLIDLNVEDDPYKALSERIAKIKPEIIGISLRNIKVAMPGAHRSCYQENIELIGKVRELAPSSCRLVMGGSAFSLYAETIMKNITYIDYGVFSEGEEAFPELVKNLDNPEKVKGIYYRKDGKLEFTGYREPFDFANSRPPRRDLIDMKKYFKDPVSVGVMSKRGCILNCIYCSDPFLLGKRIRARKPKDIADEVEDLVLNYGVKYIQFADQVFNIPIEHSMDICKEFIARKIKANWGAWLSVKPISVELLSLMEKAGCKMINFSPDSASDKTLTKQGKGFTEKDLVYSYKMMRHVDINVDYSFMFNGPGDNIFSFFKMIIFLFKAKLHLGKKMNIHASFVLPMRIYPHSKLHTIAIQDGIVYNDDDLIEQRFYNPPPLSYLLAFVVKTMGLLWHIKQKFKPTPVK